MINSNTKLLDLLGKTVSFNDLSFERFLAQLSLPGDFPKEFLSSFRKGVVIQVCFDLNSENSLCIAPNYPSDDASDYYLIEDMQNFKTY